MIITKSEFTNAHDGKFIKQNGAIIGPCRPDSVAKDGLEITTVKQTGGGAPDNTYTADAMMKDLDRPTAVVYYDDELEAVIKCTV